MASSSTAVARTLETPNPLLDAIRNGETLESIAQVIPVFSAPFSQDNKDLMIKAFDIAMTKENPVEIVRLLRDKIPKALSHELVFDVARKGSHQQLSVLMRAGFDLRCTDDKGDTPLIHAAVYFNADMVNYLLLLCGEGIVDVQAKDGMTALACAAEGQSGKRSQWQSVIRGGVVYPEDEEHVKCLISLLNAGANVNLADNDGDTPLILAVKREEVRVVDLLLVKKPNLDLRDAYGMTALHWAVTEGNVLMVKLLLGAGAHPDIPDERGFTPLMRATINTNYEIIQLLIEAHARLDLKCDSERTMLSFALSSFDVDIDFVQQLLSHPLVVAQLKLEHQDGNNMLLKVECVELLELLLKAGLDPNVRNSCGETALTEAVQNYYTLSDSDPRWLVKAVKSLLNAGADPNRTNDIGLTPLMRAMDTTVVDELLKTGAELDLQDSRGWTALFCAVLQGAPKKVMLLLAAGANPSIPNREGLTPMMVAQKSMVGTWQIPDECDDPTDLGLDNVTFAPSEAKLAEIINILNAYPHSRLKSGENLPMLCEQPSRLKELLDAGVGCDIQDNRGMTALHWAVVQNNLEKVELLLQAGAELELPSKEGVTPSVVAHHLLKRYQGKLGRGTALEDKALKHTISCLNMILERLLLAAACRDFAAAGSPPLSQPLMPSLFGHGSSLSSSSSSAVAPFISTKRPAC